jgi:phosphohistidine phosphatase
MRCYLVRHGDAKPETEDPARPLSVLGRAEVAELGQAALARGVAAAEIRHSGLLRARQTAELLAAALQPPGGVRGVDGLAPQDDPAVTAGELEAGGEPVILVGHLPHLGRLAAHLTDSPTEIELATASMLCLVRGHRGWTVEWQIDGTRAR